MVSLNLFLIDEFERVSEKVQPLPSKEIFWRPLENLDESRFGELYKMLFGTVASIMLKHFFIYEKYTKKQLNKDVDAFLGKHHSHIAHLSHPDWKARMTASGWDRIAEAFSRTLKTNFELKIRTATSKAVKSYMALIYKEQPALHDAALKLLIQPWPKRQLDAVLTTEAIDHVILLRGMLGLKEDDSLTEYPRFSIRMFEFYIRMWSRGSSQDSYLLWASFVSNTATLTIGYWRLSSETRSKPINLRMDLLMKDFWHHSDLAWNNSEWPNKSEDKSLDVLLGRNAKQSTSTRERRRATKRLRISLSSTIQ